MARVDETRRIVSVTTREDGRFCIVLGPPPDLLSFTTSSTYRVGQKLRVQAEVLDLRPVGEGPRAGTMTLLKNPEVTVVVEPYPVRVVADVWPQVVQAAMNRPLFRYQVDGAAWLADRIYARKGALLCDDPGLGKTAQVIAALCATGCFPALIVCPAMLKEQWAREFLWTITLPQVNIIEGKDGGIPSALVHIINYELLRFRENQLGMLGLRVVVFDECHALKEPEPKVSHRAAIGTRLAHRVGLAVGVSGTPVLNRPVELWRLLHIVAPREWADLDRFRRRYCGLRREKPDPARLPPARRDRALATKVGKVTHLDELVARVEPVMLRRQKHQVLQDLPQKSRRTYSVTLSAEEMYHYRQAEKDVVAWLRQMGEGLRASRAARAKAIVKMTMLRRIAALGKLRTAVPAYLANWFRREAQEPLVIFGYHRDVMLGVYNICTGLGLRVTGIGGQESPARRQAQVDAFMSGWADVFLAPLLIAGVGLNLQRASEALFIERTFSQSQLIQAEDRIHRVGQIRPVTITYIDAAGTVDDHIGMVLRAKSQLVRATVDGVIAKQIEDDVLDVAEMLVRRSG